LEQHACALGVGVFRRTYKYHTGVVRGRGSGSRRDGNMRETGS